MSFDVMAISINFCFSLTYCIFKVYELKIQKLFIKGLNAFVKVTVCNFKNALHHQNISLKRKR